jgi:hypothetical protein
MNQTARHEALEIKRALDQAFPAKTQEVSEPTTSFQGELGRQAGQDKVSSPWT